MIAKKLPTRRISIPEPPAQAVAPIVEATLEAPSRRKVQETQTSEIVRRVDYKKIIQEYIDKIGNSRTRGIRAFCMTCCNGQSAEVRHCPTVKCPLHGFRMGRTPEKQAKFDAMDMASGDEDQPEIVEDTEEGDDDAAS